MHLGVDISASRDYSVKVEKSGYAPAGIDCYNSGALKYGDSQPFGAVGAIAVLAVAASEQHGRTPCPGEISLTLQPQTSNASISTPKPPASSTQP